MFIFAHLHKCGGTSVVEAVIKSSTRLPARHANGHPAGSDGHAIGGLKNKPADHLRLMLASLIDDGAEFIALEWDFPRFERFPLDLDLKFFTIFRDPKDRFISNYIYDVVSGFTNCQRIEDYLGSQGIWTQSDYYTRFFSGLDSHEAVTERHVDYAVNVLRNNFQYIFLGEDVKTFIKSRVGIPIETFPHDHKTSAIKGNRLPDLTMSSEFIQSLREINRFDYQLIQALS